MVSLKAELARLAKGQPLYADYFSTVTGEQTRVRVVGITRERSGTGFTLQGINGESSERLTADRVSFTTY